MDQRTHPRVVAERHIVCDTTAGRISAFMYDLSLGGCMLEADGAALAAGPDVAVMLADALHPGTVVWAAGGYAGVSFANCLHPAIVEHYGFAPRMIDLRSMVPQDKFGRPLPPLVRLRG